MKKLYAVGDIHGCYHEMITMVRMIEKDAGSDPYKIVFLGDLIDRGPQSAAVVDFVRNYKNGICLKGNHEDMMVGDAVGWKMNGGESTVLSYSSNPDMYDFKSDCEWMRTLPVYHQDGEYVFVHAGLNPGKKLEDQSEIEMIWGRSHVDYMGDFLGDHYVVHGHTPRDLVSMGPNIMNLDTGCVFGNMLSGARFSREFRGPDKIFHVNSDTGSWRRRDVSLKKTCYAFVDNNWVIEEQEETQ